MKKSEKMIAWIRKQGIKLPPNITFRRTYAGHWQRSSGSWSWYIFDQAMQIGGYDSITNLLKCPTLEIEGGSVECGCIGQCRGLKGKKKNEESP